MSARLAALYARADRRDGRYDGKFYIGVVTTGIYCLPSCPARRPNPQNVRVFATEAEARAAGLRPCKRCSPEKFVIGEAAGEATFGAMVDVIAKDSSGDVDAAAIAKMCGISKTKVQELARSHAHTSLSTLIRNRQVEIAAQRLIATNDRVMDVCFDAGFESEATFHRQFTARMGLAPGAYRALRESSVFALKLPPGYRAHEVLGFHGRDNDGASERLIGSTLTKAVSLEGQPVILEVLIESGEAVCRLAGGALPGASLMVGAHAMIRRMLGFDSETAGFERLMRRRGLARLTNGRSGLRVPLTAAPFEALTWAIVGQQINLNFALKLRRALIGSFGSRVGAMRAHPTPAAIAQLDAADLLRLQFSRQKAAYLIGAARAIESGQLPLDALRTLPAARAEGVLTALSGIGRWTARYTMLRGIGFGDCVPVGDAGLRNALARFHRLPQPPDDAHVEMLMHRYRPHRSLATAHLWASLSDS